MNQHFEPRDLKEAHAMAKQNGLQLSNAGLRDLAARIYALRTGNYN